MPAIPLDSGTHRQVKLLARAWRISEGGAIARLVEQFQAGPVDDNSAHTDTNADPVPIHATYEGTRVDAVFDAATERVEILKGPLAGQAFKSPSGAAIAVVRSLNPQVQPNRNGWSFWVVNDTGHILQTLR